MRLTSTEFKKSVGEGFLLLLAQFNIFLIFVPLRVSLFRLRIILLFIFFVFIILFLIRFITFTLLTFNGHRNRRIFVTSVLIIILLPPFLVNLHHFVVFALAIFFFSIQFNPLLLGLRSF